MKRIVFIMALIILSVSYASADWTIQIKGIDYYEKSGVSGTPQPYQASPTLDTLRDLLVTVGIMSPAPPAPPPPTPASTGVVWEDTVVAWENEGITHEDT